MKKINQPIAISAAIILGLAFSGACLAAQPGEEEAAPQQGRVNEVLKKLNLTPQQEAQIKELQKTEREKAMELRRDLKLKRKELGEELEKPDVNLARVKALSAELKNAEGLLIDHRVEGVLKMKGILTPEQYRQFSNTLRKAHKENAPMRKAQHEKTVEK